MEIRKTSLEPDTIYHIFNRGNVFFEDRKYHFFLEKYAQYVYPWVKTYAYCLLPIHYYLLIQERSQQKSAQHIKKHDTKDFNWHISDAFFSLLQGYKKAMNKVYDCSGTLTLFETSFKRSSTKCII